MEREWMARQLPEKPPEGLVDWVLRNCRSELGTEYIVFKSERVPMMPGMAEIMEYNDMRPRRNEWAADCTCTACGESFLTQKVKGYDAIRLVAGEDGMPYTLDPGEPYGIDAWREGCYVEEAFSGEELNCPQCLSKVTLIHAKQLRGGRTKRIMVESIGNVCGYTTVFYWMVCRTVDEFGISCTTAEPADAYVLTERGTLVHYAHIRRNSFGSNYSRYFRWHSTSDCKDKLDTPYGDWGSICNRKAGAVVYDEVPDLEGTTGEKTGLSEFIRDGGYRMVEYLKFWRRHRNIENLCRSGQAALISGILSRAASYAYAVEQEMKKYIDLNEKKPHRMLRISKEEFRQFRNEGRALKVEDLEKFNTYRSYGGKMGLADFLVFAAEFRNNGLYAAYEIMMQSRGVDLDKIARYMMKQELGIHEAQLLVDTRRMAHQLFPDRQLTEEELWPRNLAEAHERMVRIQEEQRALKNKQEREEIEKKFAAVVERYGELEWNDGDLRILLPRSSADLHREGKVLRHCVGGYSNSHVSGSDTIFFVRKYRRPERSYYTLDIRMTDGMPREVQLHGYGNERHGQFKEHSHQIPKKVRDFIDRWKREVLMPWWVRQVQNEQKGKTA